MRSMEVFSWTPDAKASDFIAKQRLKSWQNWWTETYTELWKLLKAFVEWKIPIIDEIDLIPNDVLMRIKHLFTLRPGESYAPQEDWNARHLLKSVNIIATANIKSSKHSDREDLDPAIVRLFDNIHVNYLPKEETYDLALVSLMHREWFIYKVWDASLDKDSSALAALIYCLKDVEENYMWVWDGLRISNKDKQFLKKAVLELWRFVSMFKWYASSALPFAQYLKWEVINFITNMAYPKTDRLILVKIFSQKWFITKNDIWTKDKPGPLLRIMDDVNEKELDDNIISSEFAFDEPVITFIDPHELVNLDPFKIRKFDDLELFDKKPEYYDYLLELDRSLMTSDKTDKHELEELIWWFIDDFNNNADPFNDVKNKMALVSYLYKLWFKDEILKLKTIPWFEELAMKIIYIDMKKTWWMFKDGDNISWINSDTNSDTISDYDKRKQKALESLKWELEQANDIEIDDFSEVEISKEKQYYWKVHIKDWRILPFIWGYLLTDFSVPNENRSVQIKTTLSIVPDSSDNTFKITFIWMDWTEYVCPDSTFNK